MVRGTDFETESAKPRSWFQKIILILVAPIALPATLLFVGLPMLMLAAIMVPVSAITSRLELRRERHYQKSLAKVNRRLEWETVLSKIEDCGGTLLLEWRHKLPVRLWWTKDDVVALAPSKPPEFDKLDFLGLEPTHPFMSWCHRVYTNDNSGVASICTPPYVWAPDVVWASELKQRYAKLVIVDIVPKSDCPPVS